MTPEAPDLSVVIPACNEVENLDPLLAELRAALAQVSGTYEIVLVDDASTDGTAERITAEAARDPRVRAVLLERNSGQSAALAAGFSRVRGKVIVTLDADLQNDPADLPRVLAALDGADSSRIANGTRRAVLGDRVTDIGCSFKAYRREVLEGLPMFVGVHRFLPALCEFRGARLVEIQLSHRARRHGQSKYGLSNRMWRGIYDLIGVAWLKSRLVRYRIRDGGR